MAKIVQKDNEILHEPARPVGDDLFGTAKLKKIIADMSEALAKEDDGVALAAPQIAIPLRIFIIAGKIFTPEDSAQIKPDLIFINPKITSLAKTKREVDEGCLSVRWYFGQVKRATKATVEAYDINGNKFSRSGSGVVAQIFQHETDHLDGVLFTEKAKNLREYTPEKNN